MTATICQPSILGQNNNMGEITTSLDILTPPAFAKLGTLEEQL